jgi:hypothetical protein
MLLDLCTLTTATSTKAATSAKTAASATLDEPAPKSKKLKVLTYRPCYIEPAVVPNFGGETSSVAAPKEPTPPTQKAKKPATIPKAPSAEITEPKADKHKAEEPKTEEAKRLEILSPSTEITVPKGTRKSCGDPEKKKDGKCTRCVRNNDDFKVYSFKENRRGFEIAKRS